MIYLDNAATSLPKPPEVVAAVHECLTETAANPGRSGHRLSVDAARLVFDARERLASLLGVSSSRRIVFTQNATEAINLVLHGLLRRGDHVVATAMEHNAASRPLRYLEEQRGVAVTVAPSDPLGRVRPGAVRAAMTDRTRLVVVNHASNVVGTLAPLGEIKAAIGEVPLLVDAAQTAGAFPIDAGRQGIDLLAFTGHKSLLGPQGIGGLYVGPELELDLEPLKQGGTGSSSSCDLQPEVLPDRYESGTLNTPGIAGLSAAAAFLAERGIPSIRTHEMELFQLAWEGFRRIPGVTLYGPEDPRERVATISLNVRGLTPSQVALTLDRRHGIMVRPGLHCAPWAHQAIGTLPRGTVRLGIGISNTRDEVEQTLEAIREIAREGGQQAGAGGGGG